MLVADRMELVKMEISRFLTWSGSLVEPWVAIQCARVLSRCPGTKILVGHDALSGALLTLKEVSTV